MQRGVSFREFCRSKVLKHSTLQRWARIYPKLKVALCPDDEWRRKGSRARRLTVGGSGRVSKSRPVEDELLRHIKDLRRSEIVVTRQHIIDYARSLMPDLFTDAMDEACKAWSSRFMCRTGLTMRRITHSGRTTRADLEKLRVDFVQAVVDTMFQHVFNPFSCICPRHTVFNMDQIVIFATAGARSTVEEEGAKIVPARAGGSETFRCIATITASADSRIFPLHFVYKGVEGGTVEDEVSRFALDTVASFSVQEKAWFDERVTLKWIDRSWKFVVAEPCILLLDSLHVHMSETVLSALVDLGTLVQHVPPGATGIAQPLDVGVISPFKH
uniref:DDE-1 domain-containing protein n=1 Tax=Globisporangium ultimum (strain ATCC 200006 / CBS 805.95 / DAOM BR144) TaxID=431595 RepID=K3WPI3_GLOUD